MSHTNEGSRLRQLAASHPRSLCKNVIQLVHHFGNVLDYNLLQLSSLSQY